MSKTIEIILLLAALVCFILAVFAGERFPRINLIALGLAAWVLVPLGTLVLG